MVILQFHGAYGSYPVALKLGRYDNKRIAIQAVDEDGCPAFTATVNLPDETIQPDEAFIKDYGENQGVLAFLHETGVIVEIVRFVRSGYVNIPLCKLNMDKLRSLA